MVSDGLSLENVGINILLAILLHTAFKPKQSIKSFFFHSHSHLFTLEASRALISSFLFQCNLYKWVSSDGQNVSAECLVCKSIGLKKYIKGANTSNYNCHLKVKI